MVFYLFQRLEKTKYPMFFNPHQGNVVFISLPRSRMSLPFSRTNRHVNSKCHIEEVPMDAVKDQDIVYSMKRKTASISHSVPDILNVDVLKNLKEEPLKLEAVKNAEYDQYSTPTIDEIMEKNYKMIDNNNTSCNINDPMCTPIRLRRMNNDKENFF